MIQLDILSTDLTWRPLTSTIQASSTISSWGSLEFMISELCSWKNTSSQTGLPLVSTVWMTACLSFTFITEKLSIVYSITLLYFKVSHNIWSICRSAGSWLITIRLDLRCMKQFGVSGDLRIQVIKPANTLQLVGGTMLCSDLEVFSNFYANS